MHIFINFHHHDHHRRRHHHNQHHHYLRYGAAAGVALHCIENRNHHHRNQCFPFFVAPFFRRFDWNWMIMTIQQEEKPSGFFVTYGEELRILVRGLVEKGSVDFANFCQRAVISILSKNYRYPH